MVPMQGPMVQPDVNTVIAELSATIANLHKENAILKATIKALQGVNKAQLDHIQTIETK